MKTAFRTVLVHSTIGVLALCAFAANPAYSDQWYPQSAAPYPGTHFHCDLQPLPPDLPGIKPEDKQFIDHACAVLLKCAQEKERMLLALRENKQTQQLPVYEAAINAQLTRFGSAKVPSGLESFASDVDKAIRLQLQFFKKASVNRSSGTSYEDLLRIPEGKDASAKLFAAWDEMQKRYWLFWSGPSKDCIYHHLCALDLF
jgi:hypothetical protein